MFLLGVINISKLFLSDDESSESLVLWGSEDSMFCGDSGVFHCILSFFAWSWTYNDLCGVEFFPSNIFSWLLSVIACRSDSSSFKFWSLIDNSKGLESGLWKRVDVSTFGFSLVNDLIFSSEFKILKNN